ncbi:MAG: hypothetical protein ACK53P_17470 [Pseudanabaena sp.]|nr:hypothetical protein [Pseudanabaena mucicola]
MDGGWGCSALMVVAIAKLGCGLASSSANISILVQAVSRSIWADS